MAAVQDVEYYNSVVSNLNSSRARTLLFLYFYDTGTRMPLINRVRKLLSALSNRINPTSESHEESMYIFKRVDVEDDFLTQPENLSFINSITQLLNSREPLDCIKTEIQGMLEGDNFGYETQAASTAADLIIQYAQTVSKG